MSSQELLWINLAIGTLIALLFFVRRAQRQPSRLKLLGDGQKARGPSQLNSETPVSPKIASTQIGPGAGRGAAGKGAAGKGAAGSNAGRSYSSRPKRESISPETLEAAGEGAPIKSLNVIFNYNAHSWDAYEVLGIPAGAPMTMVKEAYDRAVKGARPESHDFLRAAYQSIQRTKR